MTNLEKYQYALAKMMLDTTPFGVSKITGNIGACGDIKCDDCIFVKGASCTYYEKVKAWANKEYIKKPILDDVERKYLSDVIRPFKNEVMCITKWNNDDTSLEWLVIKTEYNTHLPRFKKGTMYKGMETGKEYSLKELGL